MLDIPRLEPVPEGHVLTKSFYILRTFPGRWDGGQMWVEADSAEPADADTRKARRADGVVGDRRPARHPVRLPGREHVPVGATLLRYAVGRSTAPRFYPPNPRILLQCRIHSIACCSYC